MEMLRKVSIGRYLLRSIWHCKHWCMGCVETCWSAAGNHRCEKVAERK